MSIYGLKKVKHDRSENIDIMEEIRKECEPFFDYETEHDDFSIFDENRMNRLSIEDIERDLAENYGTDDMIDLDREPVLDEYDIINNVHVEKELISGDIFLTGVMEHLVGEHDTLVNKALTLKPFMTYKIGESFLEEPLARSCDESLTSICAHSSAINHLLISNILNNLSDRLFDSFVLTLDMKGCPKWMNEDYLLTMLVYLFRSRNFNAYKVKDSNTGRFVIFVCTTNGSTSFQEEMTLMKTYLTGLIRGDIVNTDGKKLHNYVFNVKDVYHLVDAITFSVKKEAILGKLSYVDRGTYRVNKSLLQLRNTPADRLSEVAKHLDLVCKEWLDLMFSLGKIRNTGTVFERSPQVLRVLGKKEVGNNSIELFTEYYNNLNNSSFWASVEGQDLLDDINRHKVKFVDNMIERYKAYYYGYLNLKTNLAEEEERIMSRMIEAMG